MHFGPMTEFVTDYTENVAISLIEFLEKTVVEDDHFVPSETVEVSVGMGNS